MHDLLGGFALYHPPRLLGTRHNVIGVPHDTRLRRITRVTDAWRVWTDTRDYVYGTFLILHDSGRVERITTRYEEGDEVMQVRPSDDEIRSMLHAQDS